MKHYIIVEPLNLELMLKMNRRVMKPIKINMHDIQSENSVINNINYN